MFSDTQIAAVGDGAFIFPIDDDMKGLLLVAVRIWVTTVSSSGIVQVQLRNVTQAVDMLSTRIQIDAGETSSSSAATPYVIDAANADVAEDNLIAVDVDAAGTGAMGLTIRTSWGRA